MYLPKLSMPYMGSKRKIANPIMNFILEQNPKTKYFYDLFGGGGAMSFEAIQRPQIKKVFYNELNTGVVELLKKIKNEGVSKELYQWITRKVFNENKNKDDWFGGLCKVVWSFGNNQSDYLFGKDIEEPKRLMHEIIVNHDKKAQEEFQRMFDIKLETEISSIFPENLNQRRLRIMVQVKKLGFERNLIELQRLQQLERLEQLEQLQRLQQLQQLEISNLSYEQVKIETPIEETIIYCDPPYKNTAKYQKSLDYERFYEWVEKNPYKIYVSSYESHLPCVFQIEHRSILDQKKKNKVFEKLFCNK